MGWAIGHRPWVWASFVPVLLANARATRAYEIGVLVVAPIDPDAEADV